MNNSKIAFESLSEGFEELDRRDFLEKERGRLAQLVEAINGVMASQDWKKIRSMLLNGVVENLEKSLRDEASKSEVNLPEVYRLQGQLLWARKYVDLRKLVDWYKSQIEHIKNQLHEENPRDGAL